jgi:recombination protein RecT
MNQPKSLALYIRSEAVQESIDSTLKDRKDDFTTSLLTVVNSNPLLQECDAKQVVQTALKAASMRLPIDPNLGLAYIIPYRNKVKIPEFIEDENGNRVPKMFTGRDGKQYPSKREEWRYEPQLQIGWRGFIQLALRTGQYATINVTDVRKSEYKGENRLTGAIEWKWIKDPEARNKKPVAGYVAYFKLHDGFEKMLYMTVEELEKHALQYSQSYKQGYGKWKDDKPAMSRKTVIKLLISKWGPQSTEMQKAFRADQAAMTEDDDYNYLDNKKGDDTDQTPKQPTEAEAPQTHPSDDIQEGEIVEPTPDDQEPSAEQEQDEKPADTRTVKERAAEWAAKGKEANHKGEQATLIDGKETPNENVPKTN